jgi:hypothetical protein
MSAGNKTKEMRVKATTEEKLSIHDKEVEQVNSFTHLGSTLTEDGGADEDVRSRIKKVNRAFIQLYPVWRNRNISKRTKKKNLNSVALVRERTIPTDERPPLDGEVSANFCG